MDTRRILTLILLVAAVGAALFAGVPSGWLGALVLAAAGAHLWVRSRSERGYSALAADLLGGVWPGVVKAILGRDRLDRWHKTSRSERPQRVWGFADRHSIDPGEPISLCLAARPGQQPVDGHVEVHRVGYHGEEGRLEVWRSEPLRIDPYSARREGVNSGLLDGTAAALGPGWAPTLTVEQTRQWSSGYYAVDFVEPDGARDSDIAYLVVTDPQRSGDVLVKLSTATYQAYNTWGGHSLYDWRTPAGRDRARLHPRGHMVSFDRPTPTEFYEWEHPFVVWIEELAHAEGFSVAYATGHDLAREDSFTTGYKLVVCPGHDEYWTEAEFEKMHARIFRHGLNTLFLSANMAYWRIRYVDVNDPAGEGGRQMVCYKSPPDPIRAKAATGDGPPPTGRFRDDAELPESMLMGVAYQSNFPDRHQTNPSWDYQVERDDLPFFEGTGLSKGDRVAGIVGHEWDNRDPEADHPTPGEDQVEGASRLWDAARSRIDAIDQERISVLFSARPVDLFGREGLAEAVYYESPAGARVFSAGTVRWSWGLGKKGYAQESFKRFNRNLVLQLLAESPGDPT